MRGHGSMSSETLFERPKTTAKEGLFHVMEWAGRDHMQYHFQMGVSMENEWEKP
jgi:hypothetical protein